MHFNPNCHHCAMGNPTDRGRCVCVCEICVCNISNIYVEHSWPNLIVLLKKISAYNLRIERRTCSGETEGEYWTFAESKAVMHSSDYGLDLAQALRMLKELIRYATDAPQAKMTDIFIQNLSKYFAIKSVCLPGLFTCSFGSSANKNTLTPVTFVINHRCIIIAA